MTEAPLYEREAETIPDAHGREVRVGDRVRHLVDGEVATVTGIAARAQKDHAWRDTDLLDVTYSAVEVKMPGAGAGFALDMLARSNLRGDVTTGWSIPRFERVEETKAERLRRELAEEGMHLDALNSGIKILESRKQSVERKRQDLQAELDRTVSGNDN